MIDLDTWPDCIVPGCPNKCCLRLNSDKCWPHTTGAPLDHNSTEIEREIYELGIGHEDLELTERVRRCEKRDG